MTGAVDTTARHHSQDGTLRKSTSLERLHAIARDDNEAHKAVQEWKPVMLRWGPAALLATYTAMLCMGLVILDLSVSRRAGLAPEDNLSAQAIRYVPTALFIILGLLWKRLVGDLKNVMPFVAMSRQWTSASDSILVDYFDKPEVLTIWPAIRQRHWPMLVGLTTSLACGLLVPLAAVLTHLSASSVVSPGVQLRAFPFEFSNALINSTQYLTIPPNTTSGKAYAQAASILRGSSELPPWTTQDHAFAQFEFEHSSVHSVDVNATIRARTDAIGTVLQCDAIRSEVRNIFNVNDGSLDFTIGTTALWGNEEDLERASCDTSLQQNVGWCEGPASYSSLASAFNQTDVNAIPFGWLNMTNCSSDGTDRRFTYTILQPYGKQTSATWWSGKDMFRAITLLCVPSFQMRHASLRIHASTHKIEEIAFEDRFLPANLGLNAAGVVAYLNNPIYQQKYGPITDEVLTPQCDSDFFTKTFQSFSLRPVGQYFDNSSLLIDDLTAVVSTTMTQLISNLARSNASVELTGELSTPRSRVVITRWSLHLLQALLAVLVISLVCLATVLRPRTNLTEDPGLLANMAVILSRSEATEKAVKDSAAKLAGCRSSLWRLTRTPTGLSQIETTDQDLHATSDNPQHDATSTPVGLRWATLISLIAFVATLIGVLVGLRSDGTTHGFPAGSEVVTTAWSLVPTTLLVLLGYAISSTTWGLQQCMQYKLLHENKRVGRATMLFNARDRSIILLPLYAIAKAGSLSLFLGALINLIYPGVKIAAAGLYTPRNGTTVQSPIVSLDTSILHGFKDLVSLNDSQRLTGLQSTASDEVDWLLQPSFGITVSPGTLSNMVFSNITSISEPLTRNAGIADSLTVRIPAISLDVRCDKFDNDDFELVVHQFENNVNFPASGNDSSGFRLSWGCTTPFCRQRLDQSQLVSPGVAGDTFWKDAEWTSHGLQVFIQNQTEFYKRPVKYDFTGAEHISLSWPCELSASNSDCGGFYMHAKADMFNITLPIRQALVCLPTADVVEVDVIATRPLLSGMNGSTLILPWTIQSYDEGSISILRTLNITVEDFAQIGMCKGQSRCWDSGPSLLSESASTSNIYELLTSYARNTWSGDDYALLNIDNLEQATKSTYVAYMATLLNQFRKNPALESAASDIMTATGTLRYPRVRVYQSDTVTIVLGVLLSIVTICLISVLVAGYANVAMQDKPGSVASQLMLLVGSETVERLRRENVETAEESRVWDERFGLGWWTAAEGRVRWGIDFGTLDPELQEEQEQILRAEAASSGEKKVKWWKKSFTLLQPARKKRKEHAIALSSL